MSSRDVRDIMELQAATPSGSQPSRSRPPDGRQKRPDGITRELYALIGDNAPSLALAQAVKPKFKERLKRAGPTVKWHWASFSNPSRATERAGDEGVDEKEARQKLRLKHWVRDLPPDHPEGAPDHKFAKFNTSSALYSYTSEEYNAHLRDDDWPREETDYLFNIARQYDLRFVIMADRWDYSTGRTVDDLKARYYAVCRRLVRSREAADEATRNKTLQELTFDKARELERKHYLKSLLLRTPAQIAEEDFLYVESRRLEQSYNKITQERAELLKILGGRDGIGENRTGVSVGVGGGVKGMAPMDKAAAMKKKNGPGWELEGLNGGGLPDGWAGEGSKRRATAAQDIANCIERHPAPSVSATKGALYPSVSIRSSRITQPKQAVLAKVQAALAELQISTHLIMPTKANVERLDALQAALVQVVELKKAVDRIELEIKVVKKRKDGLLGIVDVDAIKEEDVEADKAQRNKRSMSASSSTAGQNKRVRH